MQDTGNLQQRHGPVYSEVTLDPAISPSDTSPHIAHPAAVSSYSSKVAGCLIVLAISGAL